MSATPEEWPVTEEKNPSNITCRAYECNSRRMACNRGREPFRYHMQSI
jgi:hypothetical protein